MARKTKEQEIRKQIYQKQRKTAERTIESWFLDICECVNKGYDATPSYQALFGSLIALWSLEIISEAELDAIRNAARAVYRSK